MSALGYVCEAGGFLAIALLVYFCRPAFTQGEK